LSDIYNDKLVLQVNFDHFPAAHDGKVIEVDLENEFVIVNIGQKDGLVKDAVLSIWRNDTYLGDVQVTQVLPDMSAADLIPPLTSNNIQKDDGVSIKKGR